jgi:enolase
MIKIEGVKAYWILDSRGNPTVQAQITVSKNGASFVAVSGVPSGASTGSHEAIELRDGGHEFGGKGVQKAVSHVNKTISDALIGSSFERADQIDELLLTLDGTENKSNLGANSILSVSIAAHKAFAKALSLTYFEYLDVTYFNNSAIQYPKLMSNVINGGAHASNGLSIQEFMIIADTGDLLENVRVTTEVYHQLKKDLSQLGLATGLGDEGGFAPTLNGTYQALDLLVEAGKKSGHIEKITFALDCAATEFYDSITKLYTIDGKQYNSEKLVNFYKDLCEKYPITSIEDGCSEDDLETWKLLAQELGKSVQLVGDDLFVTNPARFNHIGLEQEIANSVLVKMNQIGTVKETSDLINLARKNNFTTIISHRSGETSDTFMSDLAIASNSEFIKLGAPARGERVAKYNRLIQIYQLNH